MRIMELMNRWPSLMASALLFTMSMVDSPGKEPNSNDNIVKVSKEAIHSGRISTMLYGGFIELLDDLVPGMWAEMLNDRNFEGVKPANNWCYTGEPSICDREWEASETWTPDANQPSNGKRSAKITATPER